MTGKEMLEVMAAGNATTNNFLFLLVGIALIMLVIVLFNSVRMNAILTNFIMGMSGRSTAANELSGAVGQANTSALIGQTRTLEAINKTGQATGAAVSAVNDKVSIALQILTLLGVDVGDIAKHVSKPTAGTKQKVDEIADRAEQTSPTPAAEKPAAPAELPPDTLEVTLPVQLIEKEKE